MQKSKSDSEISKKENELDLIRHEMSESFQTIEGTHNPKMARMNELHARESSLIKEIAELRRRNN